MKSERPPLSILAVVRWPVGGIRTYLSYTYRALPPGSRLTIVATRTGEAGLLAGDAKRLGADLVLVDGGTRELSRAVWRQLRRDCRVVLHSHGFNAAAAAFFPNLRFGLAHLCTVHGVLEKRLLRGFSGLLKRKGLGAIMRRLDAVHAVGEDIRDHLLAQWPGLARSGARLSVIANGVDAQSFAGCRESAPSLRGEVGLGPEEFVFGFLGRLMPQKGFDLLVDAVDELVRRQRTFRVLVCASGDYVREYRQDIERRGLAGRFVFIPHQGDVRRVYASVDAVVMPSRWEAWGLLKAEALISATPLIASACMGLHEGLEDSPALLIPPEDASALAGAMEQMLDWEERAQVFAAFAPQAARRFSAARSSARLVELVQVISDHETSGERPAKAWSAKGQ